MSFLKDINILIRELGLNNLPTDMLDGARIINLERPRRFTQTVKAVFTGLSGKRVAVWGLSYKGGTDDVRDSPAVSIDYCRRERSGMFMTSRCRR